MPDAPQPRQIDDQRTGRVSTPAIVQSARLRSNGKPAGANQPASPLR